MTFLRFLFRHTIELAAVESLALGLAVCAFVCLVADQFAGRSGERTAAMRELAARGLRPLAMLVALGLGVAALRGRR